MTVRASIIDKVLREIAPNRAVNRLWNKHRFDYMSSTSYGFGLGSYTAAGDSRMRTHHSFGRSLPTSEDTALGEYDRDRVRLELRDLVRNNGITSGTVDRFPSYAIWLGLWPQCQTSDKGWNNTAEDWWRDVYSPTCDYRQREGVDIVTFQKLIINHRLLDGDAGFVLLKNGQLQPVESERIRTPQKSPEQKKGEKIVQGVRITKGGITIGYYVMPRDNNGNISHDKWQFVKRENFLFCMEPKRFDQVRGVPVLAPCANKFRDYDETDQGVLNKVKNDGKRLFKRFTEDSGESNQAPRNAYYKENSDGKDPTRVEKHEWGQVENMRPGEQLEAFKSETPNSEYVEYMVHELQGIAACLGIPYEYLMLIFTQGSFSAQRAAMLHAQHTFLEWHDWVTKKFLRRVWNWRIAKAMKNGELPMAPLDENGMSEWHKVEWSVPWQGWVDPDKQAKADDAEVTAGRSSLKFSIRARGRDRDNTLGDKQDDIMVCKELAQAINTKFPDNDPVSWRDIADIGAKKKPSLIIEGDQEG